MAGIGAEVFQPFVNKRDVKDRSDEDLTHEPEMLKAFRDTWELGLHSYLTYCAPRLAVANLLRWARQEIRQPEGAARAHGLHSGRRMKVAVIMNAGAGSIGEAHAKEREEAIRAAFTAAGVEVEIHACPGARLTDTAREAAKSGVDAVVAAGGDGTVSAVATALVGGEVPLAVLPLGTLNHFARDLGMPDDLGEAAKAIATGAVGHVDAGEVNGRVFVNNSSIGLYPLIVRSREAEQRKTGHGKWRAFAAAVWRVLWRFPLLAVLVKSSAGSVLTRTPFVFIGNNTYKISPLAMGQRVALDGGHLCLYTMRARSRLKMFWLMLRALVQHVDSIADFEGQAVEEVEVVLPNRRVPVAFDGEVGSLTSPLRYRIRAGALPVVRPPAATSAKDVPDAKATEAKTADANAPDARAVDAGPRGREVAA